LEFGAQVRSTSASIRDSRFGTLAAGDSRLREHCEKANLLSSKERRCRNAPLSIELTLLDNFVVAEIRFGVNTNGRAIPHGLMPQTFLGHPVKVISQPFFTFFTKVIPQKKAP
jgi:hypothetical protein